MPRPLCPRRVETTPASTYFKPRGVPVSALVEVRLTVDELESLRLADLEGLYHEDAAARMNVSRATFGRIVEAARRKVAGALVSGHALRIEGGALERPGPRSFWCPACGHSWHEPPGTGRPERCPACGGAGFRQVDAGRGASSPGGRRGRGRRRGLPRQR